MSKVAINLLWMAGLVLPAFGQFKNILLDSMADKHGRFPIEPTVTINYKTPTTILVAAFPDHLYLTSDGGSTWKKTKSRSEIGRAHV